MISAAAVRDFQLTRVPPQFLDDPYPWYAALRAHDPVHALEGGGVFLSRYDDALAVYRDPHASSDKKAEFRPKLGDSPLYEHHTTSLVFNDPPLHTRVRRHGSLGEYSRASGSSCTRIASSMRATMA